MVEEQLHHIQEKLRIKESEVDSGTIPVMLKSTVTQSELRMPDA